METILSIAGKPGLYKLVSRGNRNLIVEALDATHRRMPAFASDRVTSLGDIAMYTDAEDIPLWQVLKNLGEKEQSKECRGIAGLRPRPRSRFGHQEAHPVVQHSRQQRHHRLRGCACTHRGRQH